MIICENLARRFGRTLAVDGLTFHLPAGSLCAFMGGNGAGKSTTLALLSGQLPPTGGHAEVGGLDPSRDRARLQRLLGVVPDRLALFDTLTLEEHVRLVGQVHGLKRAVAAERTDRLFELLGLEGKRHCAAEHASHGMRKKTALAMALVHAPRVLLLDEPFEGLDPGASADVQSLLRAFAAGGGTVLFSCHILPVVSALADRCLVIEGGRPVGDLSGEALKGLAQRTPGAGASSREALTWLTSFPS